MIDIFPRGPVPGFLYCVRTLSPPRRFLRNGVLVGGPVICAYDGARDAAKHMAAAEEEAQLAGVKSLLEPFMFVAGIFVFILCLGRYELGLPAHCSLFP
jgi:hypothetical protein